MGLVVELYSFLNLSTTWEWWPTLRHCCFTTGKDSVLIVQEAVWASGPVWMDAENLNPTGIGSLTVQPVTSRYINYAIPAPSVYICMYVCIYVCIYIYIYIYI